MTNRNVKPLIHYVLFNAEMLWICTIFFVIEKSWKINRKRGDTLEVLKKDYSEYILISDVSFRNAKHMQHKTCRHLSSAARHVHAVARYDAWLMRLVPSP